MIVIDNTLWSGRVVDPQDDDTRAIAALNDKLAADERVVCVQLTVRDGVTLSSAGVPDPGRGAVSSHQAGCA